MGTSLLSPALLLAAVVAAPVVDQAGVSQAEIDGFVRQVKSCWNLPPDDIGSGLGVTLQIELDRDGAVIDSAIAEAAQSEIGQRIARSALRAVVQCAPYTFSPDSYAHWRQLRIVLQP